MESPPGAAALRSGPFLRSTSERHRISANEGHTPIPEDAEYLEGVKLADSASEGSSPKAMHLKLRQDGSTGGAEDGVRPSRMRIHWQGNGVANTYQTTERGFMSAVAEPFRVEKSSGVRLDKDVGSRVMKVLKKFDVDGDDTLDVPEVTALVEHLLAEEQHSRNLTWAIIGLIAFTVVLLAAMTGVTYAIVSLLKDTKIENDVYLVSKSGNVIKTGSSDYDVFNGVLTWSGQNQSALRVSSYSGTPQGINSAMDINDLMELNYLHIYSPDGYGELALRVNGVARKKMPQSLYGTVVDILTAAGSIVLDGEDIFFDASMSPVFEEAGFRVGQTTTSLGGSNGRRLLDDNTAVTGRYNRLVEVLPPPPVQNAEIAQAWLIEATNKEEAKNATKLLEALRVEDADESEYATMWRNYKTVYGKVYPTMADDLVAFRTWIKNMLRVLNINTDDTLSYWTSPNQFSDVEFDKLKTLLLNSYLPNTTDIELNHPHKRRNLLEDTTPLEEVVDWRLKGMVTKVKDQGICGSCWVYSAVAAIESALLITYPRLDVDTLDLSEQHLINCVNGNSSPYFQSMGCDGGDPYEAISYSYMFNVTSEKTMPDMSKNSGKTMTCDLIALRSSKIGDVAKLAKDADYVYPFNSEEAIMRAVMLQPISAYFMVDETFMDYAGGVYVPTTCTNSPNHNMLIVGYNRTAPIPYWLIKNQWGYGWGEKGYARVAMTGDEWGPCGLYSFTAYPPLDFVDHPTFTKPIIGKETNESGGNEVDGSGAGSGNGDVEVVEEDDASPPSDDGNNVKKGAGKKGKKKKAIE